MAMELDPLGERTLGVITKLDIMDKGTNAKKILLNKEISLNLGYVGVKLRSQMDINNKKNVKACLEDEKTFFSTHPVYSTLPEGYLGIEILTKKLTNILFKHIRKYLPDIVKEIKERIKVNNGRLQELGPGLPVDDSEK